VSEPIMRRLVMRYLELQEAASRPARALAHPAHVSRLGRSRRVGPGEALLKKIDLDLALEEVYQRFFGG